MNFNISIKARLVRAAHAFVATDESRYYLHGVYIEPHKDGGALVVATDGHRLFCAYDPEATCAKPVIVKLNRPILDACISYTLAYRFDDWGESDEEPRKVDDGTDRLLEITDDGRVQISGVLRDLTDSRIDGTFPEWRKIIPTPVAPAEAGSPSFNARYLGEFSSAAEILGDRTAKRIRVLSSGTSSPALVLFPHASLAFGVLMPTKHDDTRDAPPPFAVEPKQAAAA